MLRRSAIIRRNEPQECLDFGWHAHRFGWACVNLTPPCPPKAVGMPPSQQGRRRQNVHRVWVAILREGRSRSRLVLRFDAVCAFELCAAGADGKLSDPGWD